MKKGITALLLLLFSSAAVTQNVYELDTATVVSARVPQKVWESGRNILIFNHQDITKLPVNNIDELIRFLPGIEVQSRGAFGVQSDITLRGSTFSQVLIIIDGVRINDPLTGHFNSNIPISISEIERIEIIKGPAAAIYGADAVGGVIHIISKTFWRSFDSAASEGEISLKWGEYDLISTEAGAFFSRDNIKVAGGVQTNSSAGQMLPTGIRSYFDVKTVSASVAVPVGNNSQLMYRSGYDSREFMAQYFYTRSPFDLSEEKISNFWNHLKYQNIGTDHLTTVDIALRLNHDWFLFNPAFPPANEHQTSLMNIHINRYQKLSSKLALSAGIQADKRAIESNDRGDHEEYHSGAYFIGKYNPNSLLTLGGSIRGDWDENYGFEILPQVNASYVINNAVFRAAAGRTIRAADYTERFISTNLPGPLPAGRNYGNPGLAAESALSAEAGADIYFGDKLKLSTTAFYRDGKNIIDYVPTPGMQIDHTGNLNDNSVYFYAQNILDVQTTGIEAELKVSHEWQNDHQLNIFAGYTFLNTNTGDSIVAAKYITGHAKHIFTANAIFSHPGFILALNGLYKIRNAETAAVIDSELQPNYTIWNGRIDLNIYQSRLWITVQVKNIFDEQYADILGAKMPSRWTMAGIKYRL